MLLECGETDAEEIRSLMKPEFVAAVEQFMPVINKELAPAQTPEQLKILGQAIGEYLAIAGLGSEENQLDFISASCRMLSKLPFRMTVEAIRAAPTSCPWPRDLVPFVTESVTTRTRISAQKQQTAQKLLEIWSDR